MRWVRHVARIGIGQSYTGCWWGTLIETDHLEDLYVDGRITLSWIISVWDGEHGQSREWLLAFVNAVMNLPFQYNAENYLTD
jgi:hypothetical protein